MSARSLVFIITLTVVAFAANSQVASIDSSIRDAAMEIHSCLNENAVASLVKSRTAGEFELITVKFESLGACEAAVSIECIISEPNQLFRCYSPDDHVLEPMFGPMDPRDFDDVHDAPAHSQEPTTLQLIQDEMRAPVTEE